MHILLVWTSWWRPTGFWRSFFRWLLWLCTWWTCNNITVIILCSLKHLKFNLETIQHNKINFIKLNECKWTVYIRNVEYVKGKWYKPFASVFGASSGLASGLACVLFPPGKYFSNPFGIWDLSTCHSLYNVDNVVAREFVMHLTYRAICTQNLLIHLLI